MYTGRILRHNRLFGIVLCSTLAATILAACGTNSGGTSTGSISSSQSSATTSAAKTTPTIVAAKTTPTSSSSKPSTGPAHPSTTPTLGGNGTAYGCPSNVVVNTALAAPDVTIGPQRGSGTIDVRKGDLIEIQMPFGLLWQGPTTSQGVLQLQTPFGYAWKPSNACIWRFVASGSGLASLTFSGRPICRKTALCVPAEAIALFNFKVS
jgi:hypothetical protein